MRDHLAGQHLRTVAAGGVPTRVYEAGAGEPMLLLHGGYFGSLYSLDCWSLNLPGLAERFRVIAFDKLGQGHTGNPASAEEYTFERLLGHALALLDELAPGPLHLVGHSMGALLAAAIVFERPELARSLVVIDSNTLAPDDARFPRGAFYRELESRLPPGPPTARSVRMEPDEQSFAREHVSDDFVRRLLEIARLPAFAESSAARIRDRQEPRFGPTLEAARARALETIDASGVPCPTLVLWGADDLSAPLPLGEALFARIAARSTRAEFHVFARAGHYSYREHPEAFDRLLAAFCGGH